MGIYKKEVHETQINANLTDAELKQAILDWVLKQTDIKEDFTHRTWLSSNHGSSGVSYTASCEIRINHGKTSDTQAETTVTENSKAE